MLTFLYNLWTNRNQLLYRGRIESPYMIFESTLASIRDYKHAMHRLACDKTNHTRHRRSTSDVNRRVNWQASNLGILKINVDVAVNSQGVVSIGAIAQDSEGISRRFSGKSHEGLRSSELGETLAFWEGIELAREILHLRAVVWWKETARQWLKW